MGQFAFMFTVCCDYVAGENNDKREVLLTSCEAHRTFISGEADGLNLSISV